MKSIVKLACALLWLLFLEIVPAETINEAVLDRLDQIVSKGDWAEIRERRFLRVLVAYQGLLFWLHNGRVIRR